MNTTFDRYLIARYLQIFVILFVSVFGLYVVIDGFSNVDEFQQYATSSMEVMTRMVSYYAYQASWFLELMGPILTVIDGMIVFSLLLRNSELHPILAAGVPTRRLLFPVLASTLLVNGLMGVNQEFIIPRIAHVLQAPRDAIEKGTIEVEPLGDYSTGIFIEGKEISLETQEIKDAQFVLPARIVRQLKTIRAEVAAYRAPKGDQQPGGWLLKNAQTPYSSLQLTEEGKTKIRQLKDNSKDIFVVSEISCDQLYNRSQSFRLLSTPELIRRLRSPAYGQSSMPGLAYHLHARLVRPLANAIVVLVAVPLILRKESRGLVTSMAVCMAVLICVLGFSEAVAYFGKLGTISPRVAAWLPILSSGVLAAWLSSLMLT